MADITLLNDLLRNNTFDMTAIEDTLYDIKFNSFKYLHNLQLDLVGYMRFDFKMQDLKEMQKVNHRAKVFPRKYALYIDNNFIPHEKRHKYKTSTFFNKELSIFDTAKNSDIFEFTYMVFVDGKFVDTVNLLPREDKTYILFDINDGTNTTGLPYTYYKSMLDKNANITIFFVPNCSYGVFTTNRYVLQQYSNNLSLTKFNMAGNLDTDVKYLTFVNSTDELFGSVVTDTTNSADMIRFYNNNLTEKYDNKHIFLNIFGFRNLLDQVDLPSGNDGYFQVNVQDMPIPAKNMMIFRVVNGEKFFAHDLTIKMYYPNIYQVVGNTSKDQLCIYVFYSDDTPTISQLKYKNELSLYYSFATNILQQYKGSTIPDIIKNYDPFEFVYDIPDFNSSEYNYDDYLYKINKLKTWIGENDDVLYTYLYKQYLSAPDSGYYLDVSKLNLASKFRTNNYTEITDVSQRTIFTEGRYVFILRNDMDSNYYNLRFYIDGKMYEPDKKYKDNTFEYYYIPASLISSDSIIEIERFNLFAFDDDLIFTDTEEVKTINIGTGKIYVNVNDIFFTKKSTDEYIISKDNFEISVKAQNGSIIIIDNEGFKEVNGTFYARLKNPDYVNIPLRVYIKKQYYTSSTTIKSAVEAANVCIFNIETHDDPRQFRIFRNGYTLPLTTYNIDFGDQLTDKFSVGINMVKPIGDTFTYECTPYKLRQVYFSKEIDLNGFIDLKGLISRPFELKWYDVYVNGLKLTKKNIDIISATKIFVKNVKSTKNFFVIEKDRDDEFFSLDQPATLNDKLWDNVPEFKNYLMNRNGQINDIMDDIITQTIDQVSEDLMSFFDLIMPQINFFNPDLQQLTEADVSIYPSIFKTDDHIILMNPDDGYNSEAFMKIYPDVKK